MIKNTFESSIEQMPMEMHETREFDIEGTKIVLSKEPGSSTIAFIGGDGQEDVKACFSTKIGGSSAKLTYPNSVRGADGEFITNKDSPITLLVANVARPKEFQEEVLRPLKEAGLISEDIYMLF